MKLATKFLSMYEAKNTIKVSGEDDSIMTVKGVDISVNKKKWQIAKKDGKFYISKDGKVFMEVDSDNPALKE
jgi:hypothetical protein